jgi:hypothetical protein
MMLLGFLLVVVAYVMVERRIGMWTVAGQDGENAASGTRHAG